MLSIIAAIGTPSADAAEKKNKEKPAPVDTRVFPLEATYAARLEALRAEISKAIPAVDEAKKSAYLAAREVDKAALVALNEARQKLADVSQAEARINHAKGTWIGGTEKSIAAAKEQLAAATSDAERQAAQEQLAKEEENLKAGQAALVEREAILEAAKRERPAVEKNVAAAEKALEDDIRKTESALEALGLDSLLSSGTLDTKLAEFELLRTATPRGLAEFAARGPGHEKLLADLLSNPNLMLRMAVASGAKGGRYGEAMEIYTAILKARDKAHDGILNRLALATALEHAVPVERRKQKFKKAPETKTAAENKPEVKPELTREQKAMAKAEAKAKAEAQKKARAEAEAAAIVRIDPVQRYLHFEKAFLAGELDAGFKDLSTWDYRMVVDGEEPDHILAWGREMLHNYRPDHISTTDHRWRYVAVVRSDVKYSSKEQQYDEERLDFYQNILKNGGVCGRRAFFGRFILRAFGIPTVPRPQRGHAALAHWTPDGWVVCLGAGWGKGWIPGAGGERLSDLDFLAMTQARMIGEPSYLRVLRAHWIGDAMGEDRAFGFLSHEPAFWNSVALGTQRRIIREANATTLAAVGEDIGEANETKEKVEIIQVDLTDEDRAITVDANGVITIPAAACSKPTASTAKILFMPSKLGGKQLHYNRNGEAEDFEYTFDAPKAGKYALTARACTSTWRQGLTVTANGAEPIALPLPFTVGAWDTTEAVEITLQQGRNVLTFSRPDDPTLRGATLRDFTLTPVR